MQALEAGHDYSTQGPVIEAIRFDGDDLVVDCSPAFGVYLQGKGSRVVVVDDQGRSAWSNPMWRTQD